jgi:hypothetical protein
LNGIISLEGMALRQASGGIEEIIAHKLV